MSHCIHVNLRRRFYQSIYADPFTTLTVDAGCYAAATRSLGD